MSLHVLYEILKSLFLFVLENVILVIINVDSIFPQDRNKFEQTVLYAISLGGDTDTIATMAAAIAGALYGMEQIPESWQYYCEGVADAETQAEGLYKLGAQ